MRIPDRVEQFIYRSRRSFLVAAALLLSFVKTGVWYMPNFELWKTLRFDPFHNPFIAPDTHYLFWNWLGPFLAWRLKIHNEQSFLYFYLFFSIAFSAAFIGYIFAALDEKDARTALVLFLAIPASATAYFWIGMDSLTLALMLLIVLLREHALLALLVGIALGMQHAEQGIVAFAALFFALVLSSILDRGSALRVQDKGFRLSWAALVLAGIILGRVVLVIIFRHYGVQVNSGRPFYLRKYGQMFAVMFFYHFEYVLWSLLGVGWIAVAKYAERGRRALPFLISLLGLMLLTPIVGDETRVLAIVTFPLIAAYLLLNPEFLRSLTPRLVTWVFGIWLLVPWPWTWGGTPLVSIFPYNLAYLLHHLFGWFNVPPNQPMWPFQ